MEYNDPNTTTNETSQDVGYLQPGGPVNPGSQYNCTAVTGGTVLSNPLNIATTGGGSRDRAIGTGNALKINRLYANSSSVINNLGYGFWSTANFAGYAGVTTAKYLTVDGEDPLGASGVIPTTPAEVAAINFAALYTANTTGKNYPLWSLIRLVNIGSSAPTTLTNLVSAAQAQVGTTHDFALPSQLQVVRSHFIPPVGTGEPTIAFDGHVGLTSSACSATEAGGDVGGVVIALKGAAMPPEPDSDNTYCSSTGIVNGQTGHRR
jgi:hypothetical protein